MILVLTSNPLCLLAGIGNGTRQGRVLSVHAICAAVNFGTVVTSSKLGCNIGGLFVNMLAYADDMVLLAPSWYALESLIKILHGTLV